MTSAIATRASAADIAAAWNWIRASWGGGAAPPVVATIGLGNAVVLDALDRHAPATKLLVLEPNPAAMDAVRTNAAWQAWREAGRLAYLIGPDYAGADQAWRIFPTRFEAPAFVIHPDVALGPAVAKAADVLKKILVGADANSKARQKFAPRYLVNSLKNLPSIVTGPSVMRFRGAFSGMPAIVVGAGPSLDEAYDDLRAASGRAVIIATDTALRPLLANGIRPQLVVGLDPSETNARHFFSLPECRDTWLVAESSLDPRAAAVFAGRTFWCRSSEHQPWPWLRSLGAEDGHLQVWGSVLTGAFQAAVLGGCDRIAAVGADLSYAGGRPYARGTTYEFDWAWAAAFGTDVAATWQSQMSRGEIVHEPDVNGAPTPTTPVLLAFRDWLLAQAKSGERRLVNASRAGMLYGPGIEQAGLADVLGGRIALTSFDECARARGDVRPSAIAKDVRSLHSLVKAGALNVSPFPEWTEFSGGSFDAAAVGAALDEAATALESKRGRAVAPFSIAWDLFADTNASGIITKLPELTTRARAALRGERELPFVRGASVVQRADRAETLVRALELLRTIADEVLRGDDFVSWPDPKLIADVPAAGVGMWPDTVRWGVSVLEALLGKIWNRVESAPELVPFGLGPTAPCEAGDRHGRDARRRPFATHACVLLILEWLRAVSSLEESGAEALRPGLTRLATLEQLLRTWPLPEHPGPRTELVVEASGPRSATVVLVPLGLADSVLSRLLTGTVREHDFEMCEIGRAQVAGVAVRVGIRAEMNRRAPVGKQPIAWPAVGMKALTPRLITDASRPAAVIAGQAGDDVLLVTPFTSETHVLKSDGSIAPYQTWPRAITGALSLGDRGDIAWSNVLNAKANRRPYLMYRPSPRVDVEIIDLPFRPSAAIWWNGRVFWNGQPVPDARGGIGSWAPGQDVRFEWADLALYPIVSLGDRLGLESMSIGKGDVVLRRRTAESHSWVPGETPQVVAAHPYGATTSIAIGPEWTAYAHPHADLIRLVADDGQELTMRCYYPLRLAWAGRSLAVSTGEREVVFFENIADVEQILVDITSRVG